MVFWNQKEEINREKGKKTNIHTKATGALKVRGDRASTSSSTTRSSTSHPLPPFHQRHFHHQTNQGLLSWHPKPKCDSDQATEKKSSKIPTRSRELGESPEENQLVSMMLLEPELSNPRRTLLVLLVLVLVVLLQRFWNAWYQGRLH